MTDIEEAISYIESTEKHLRHLGEIWYADYLSDAIDLLKDQKETEPDYKKYISVEWLENYYSSKGMDAAHRDVMHIISMWIDAHEMCCCEKKDEAIE